MLSTIALEGVGVATTATEIITTSLNTLKTDMMAGIGAAAPIALSIGGAIAVITLGWKLFKRFSK